MTRIQHHDRRSPLSPWARRSPAACRRAPTRSAPRTIRASIRSTSRSSSAPITCSTSPPRAAGVSRAEVERLHGWFESIGLGYGDRISVDDGYGAGRARDDVAASPPEYGLLLADGAPVTPGRCRPASVRVVVSRDVASVPGCPDWDAEDNGVDAAPEHLDQLRLRDQCQPRGDDRRSAAIWSAARPDRATAPRAPPRAAIRVYPRAAADRPAGPAGRHRPGEALTMNAPFNAGRAGGASRSVHRLRLRRRDRRAAAADRRRAWLVAGEGQQGRPAQRGPVAVGLGQPEHPVRRSVGKRRSAERHQRARRSLRARHGGDRRRPGQRRAPLSRPARQRHPGLSAEALLGRPAARRLRQCPDDASPARA